MKLSEVLAHERARRISIAIGVIYYLIYLYSIGNITPAAASERLGFMVVDDWLGRMFTLRAPFLWEPVAAVQLPGVVTVFISIPNLALGLALSALVALNVAIAVYTYYAMPIRPGIRGLLGLIPSLFTGFVCCVPTFLLTLGTVSTSFTMFFIGIRQFLIPLSLVLLSANLVWSLRSMPDAAQGTQGY